MNAIQKKMAGKTGSSLFLAIVFFLFCFFVGGTILAAATANGGRLAALKRDRSEYYRQRNAAVLIQDQLLGGNPQVKPQITINRIVSQTWSAVNPQKASDLKPDGLPTTEIKIATANCSTNLQNYICETVIRSFPDATGSVNLNGTSKAFSALAGTTGSVTITGDGLSMKADYTCSCDFSDLDSFGNILFQVKDNEDRNGQFQVSVPAHAYATTSSGSRDASFNNTTKVYTITRETTTTYTITLDNAVIRKTVTEAEGGSGA